MEAHNSPYREENHSRGMGLVLDLLLSRASQLLVDHSAALCVCAAIFPSRLHVGYTHTQDMPVLYLIFDWAKNFATNKAVKFPCVDAAFEPKQLASKQ